MIPAKSPNKKTVGHDSDLSNGRSVHFSFPRIATADCKIGIKCQAQSFVTFGQAIWFD